MFMSLQDRGALARLAFLAPSGTGGVALQLTGNLDVERDMVVGHPSVCHSCREVILALYLLGFTSVESP